MIHEFNKPIPCVTSLGDAYAIYIESSGMFENDLWTCVLCEDGSIKHFTTDQLKIFYNATFGINKKNNEKESS